MSEYDAVPWALLERYLAGDATPAERKQVELWVAKHPEHATVLDGAVVKKHGFVGAGTVVIRAGFGKPVAYRFVIVHLSHQSPTDSYHSLAFCG